MSREYRTAIKCADHIFSQFQKRKLLLPVLFICAIFALSTVAFLRPSFASSKGTNTEIGNWNSATAYPGYADPSCTVAGSYDYCVGGYICDTCNGGEAEWSSNVYYAELAPQGGIASTGWQQTTSYPTQGDGQACATYDDYIYCVGGDLTTVDSDSAFYAQLSPTGGIQGSWTQTTSYPLDSIGMSCVIYSGYIYCIGGSDPIADTQTSAVWFASVSSSGIGIWQFEGRLIGGADYPIEVTSQGCATSGSFVYCVAGNEYDATVVGNSALTNVVYYNQMSTTGGLVGSWDSATSYPQSLTGVSCFVNSDNLFCVGGDTNTDFPPEGFQSTANFVSNFYSAEINPAGGLGAWQSLSSFPQVTAFDSCVTGGGVNVCVTLGTGPGAGASVYYINPDVQLQDQNSCQAIGGSWAGSTCTLSSALQIDSDSGLEVTSGTTLNVTGSGSIVANGFLTIDSGGTLNNAGTITSNSAFYNDGSFANSGTLDNYGDSPANAGTLTNSGTMNNGQGSSALMENTGTLSNSGTMSDAGSFILQTTGSVVNTGTLTIHIDSTLAVTVINSQYGTLTNYGSISNSGTIDGYTQSIFQGCGGSISGNQPPAGSIQEIPCAPAITTASGVTISSSPVISGTENLNGGGPVTIYISTGCFLCNDYITSTTTNSSGYWSVAVPLSPGTYTVFAQASADNSYATSYDSGESNTISVTVDHNLDQSTCQSVILASWNGATKTCTFDSTFTVGPTDSLQVGSGVSLVTSGAITVQGSLSNYGNILNYNYIEIDSGGSIFDSGTFTMSGALGSTPTVSIYGTGTFVINLNSATCKSFPLQAKWSSASDTCSINSAFTLNSGYVLDIPSGTALQNSAAFTNDGEIQNSGVFSDSCTGTFTGNAVSGNQVEFNPCAPVITTASGVVLGSTVSISGTSNLGSNGGNPMMITLYSGANSVGSTTTNSAGGWTISADLAPGFYTLDATATSSSNIVSAISNKVTITFQYLDSVSCKSPIGGTWTTASSTCKLSGSYSLSAGDTLQIPLGSTLTVTNTGSFAIQGGATLSLSGEVSNAGTFFGNVSNTFTVNSGGSFSNGGQLTDDGILTVSAGGTFTNSATLNLNEQNFEYSAGIESYGSFYNSGSVNFGSESNGLLNFGTFTNTGSLAFYSSTLQTSGTFANKGDITSIFTAGIIPEIEAQGGNFSNSGVMNLLQFGISDIHAQFVNEIGGIVNNQFQFVVDSGGSMLNQGTFINSNPLGESSFSGLLRVTTTLTNDGVIDNHYSLTNDGTIANSGSIVEYCATSSFSGNAVSGNALIVQQCSASDSATVETSGGAASSDQTSVTQIKVSVSGSSAPDGTNVTITTEDLTSGTSSQSTLTNPSYYDVSVIGIVNGNAQVCISTSDSGESLTMQYWNGTAWVSASKITKSGSTVICGTIPVQGLVGTNIVVGTLASTTTSVECNPSNPASGSPTTCDVTVTDTSSTPSTPTGSVTFSSSGPGTFSASSCSLTPINGTSSGCSVSFTPSSTGMYKITADYGGDSFHVACSGSVKIKVS
jgi:hypothetical protein